ncbi:MAG: HAMP domain-containing protein [Oscillochloris sp.]|nr:HAMP domain-containing protein [Oscillochloris sp.]
MRPRIFSLMLTAFALVIVLGLFGMGTFFWLAVADFEHRSWGGVAESQVRAEVARLGDLYTQDGWDVTAVDTRLREIERNLAERRWETVTLLDAEGRVIATQSNTIPLSPRAPAAPSISSRERFDGMMMPDGFQQILPIESDGKRVGALVVTIDGQALMESGTFDRERVGRGMISATLALLAVLLGLAALFSSRISTPLRHLTAAAQSLAGGDMTVRVQPSTVREVGELAGAFNGMADTLVRADQQRRQLTADVAHELRTPLSIIKGRLEGIQDGIYQADDAHVAGLLGEVALLERLIEDLRLLALADAGQLPLYTDTLNIARLLTDIRASFAPEAERREIALDVQVAENLPEISADPQRLAQVLGNLVSNALRHTAAGGTVMLQAESNPHGVTLHVCDNGAGIRAEDLPYIFERFYRADKARTRSSGGAGLGLAIARRIIEAHGGTISAASTPGAAPQSASRFQGKPTDP